MISEEQQITICIDHSHKTYENILKQKAFTVSIADQDHVANVDYVGMISGNNEANKINIAKFTTSKSSFVNAPIINELYMTLDCQLIRVNNDGNVTAKIINVSADEKIISNNKIDLFKLNPITFDQINSQYLSIGTVIAKAFSEGKKVK